MCEYAHAMGNGPGGLMEYWDAILQISDGCRAGLSGNGSITAFRQRCRDGKTCFAYGGDFGDEPNDGNFVCDGLVFPDRTPPRA